MIFVFIKLHRVKFLSHEPKCNHKSQNGKGFSPLLDEKTQSFSKFSGIQIMNGYNLG